MINWVGKGMKDLRYQSIFFFWQKSGFKIDCPLENKPDTILENKLVFKKPGRMIYAAEVNIIWQETNIKDTLILNLYIASAQLNLILLIAV